MKPTAAELQKILADHDAAQDLLGHQKDTESERMIRELMKRLKKEGVTT